MSTVGEDLRVGQTYTYDGSGDVYVIERFCRVKTIGWHDAVMYLRVSPKEDTPQTYVRPLQDFRNSFTACNHKGEPK